MRLRALLAAGGGWESTHDVRKGAHRSKLVEEKERLLFTEAGGGPRSAACYVYRDYFGGGGGGMREEWEELGWAHPQL